MESRQAPGGCDPGPGERLDGSASIPVIPGRDSGVVRDEVRRRLAVNVARLREDRELTRAALAERVGWSRSRIGKIERGLADLDGPSLRKLAEALHTTWGDLYSKVRPLRSVRFRARKRMHGRAQILAEVSHRLDTYRRLETELGDTRRFDFAPARGFRDPVAAARAAREAVGLRDTEPIADLCGLLERHGVKVLRLDKKRDSFYGLGVGESDGGPAVVVNTWDRIAVERWIFTAAHELGHLVLHPGEYDPDATDFLAPSEWAADAFAGEFLMPEAAFARVWEATEGGRLVPRVLKIKRVFRVGYRTVLRHLVATGRADTGVWHGFRQEYANEYDRALPPADESAPPGESEFAWDWKRTGEPAALSEHDCRDARLLYLLRQAADRGLVGVRVVAVTLGIHYEDALKWVRRMQTTGPPSTPSDEPCEQSRILFMEETSDRPP